MTSKVIHIKPRRTAAPKKRRSKQTRYTRIAVTTLAIAGVLFGVGAVISKAAKPYVVGYSESREITEITQQIAEEEARRRELKSEIRYLQTPAGMEAEARKLGWVKEGEISVVVENAKKEPTPEEVSPKSPFVNRIGDGITGLFGSGKPKQ